MGFKGFISVEGFDCSETCILVLADGVILGFSAESTDDATQSYIPPTQDETVFDSWA